MMKYGNVSKRGAFLSTLLWGCMYIIAIFLAVVRFNPSFNWYGAAQVTLSLQEGAINRRFLVGSVFYPILNVSGYDESVVKAICLLGIVIFFSIVFLWYLKVSTEYKVLLLFGMVLMPGVNLITSVFFIEIWGYSLFFFSLWLLDREKARFLPFLFLGLSFAASEHAVVFGSLLFIYLASRRFGYLLSTFYTLLVAAPFIFTTLFIGAGEERMVSIFEKVVEGSPKATFATYQMLISPVLGTGFLNDGTLGAFSSTLDVDVYSLNTFEVLKWSVLFGLCLFILCTLLRSSLHIYDLLLCLVGVFAPVFISWAGFDYNRWMNMVSITAVLFTYFLTRDKELTYRVFGVVLLCFAFIVTEFISVDKTFGGEEINWYLTGFRYFLDRHFGVTIGF